ncbi:MAG: hypothetical protein PHC60_07510 [Heliobacteriaceae bacterium]|nr:hypothetical protein [Heliobacteriaceae bacterium]MDD4588216.1 hypothetical protein [Heliobacteriaceae bacterium]
MKRAFKYGAGLLLVFGLAFATVFFGVDLLEKYGIVLGNRNLHYDYVLKNGTIVDGAGNPRFQADIGIKKGRVAFIGLIQPPPGVKVIEATSLLILPGFIDLYSRLDGTVDSPQTFDNLLKQGITTVLSGQGSLNLGLAPKTGLPVNYAVLAGQQGLFSLFESEADEALNDVDLEFGQLPPPVKPLSKPPVDQLLPELEQSLDQGAFGLAIDLNSELGRQLTVEDTKALAAALGERGAILSLTLPTGFSQSEDFLAQVVTLRKDTGARILLSPGVNYTGASEEQTAAMAAGLQQVCQSAGNIYLCLYPSDRLPNGLRQNLQRAIARYPADRIEIVTVGGHNPPTLVGKTLAEIARERGLSEMGAAKELLASGLVQVTLRLPNQEQLGRLATAPFAFLTVDPGLGEDSQFSAGAIKEFLAGCVVGRKLISWEEVALKLAARPCALLGIDDRGMVKTGNWADLVVIDPRLLSGQDEGSQSGIRYVFVNGSLVLSPDKMPPEGQGQGQLLRS